MRRARFVLFAVLLLCCGLLHAQPRAWLDRERIALGETVTLNIENNGRDAPDYAPLAAAFDLDNRTSSSRFEMFNGRASMRTQFSVALRPRAAGALLVPALRVGNGVTAPLRLQVDAAAPAPSTTPLRAGDDIFIESVADATAPYVQQTVGWGCGLYPGVWIVSGQLDQPAPDGASLQRVGDDAQFGREIGGRRYQVVERHFLLIPERSGTLTMPGAVFQGRGVAGFFDRVFGDGTADLQARAAPHFLRVRALPTGAPQPWLPLRSLQLKYRNVPTDLRAGAASALEIEASADGATAAQLPDLVLPPIDGVQVFADAPRREDHMVAGRPTATVVRRFSLVPEHAGAVRIASPSLAWWDVGAGAARTARLPPLSLQVTGTAARGADDASPSSNAGGSTALIPAGANARAWALAALAFAALWMATLVWALHRRGAPVSAGKPVASAAPSAPPANAVALRRALEGGDLGDIADALSSAAGGRSLDDVMSRLDDAPQRAALDALQRARWGQGDAAGARAALRRAFATGPRWKRDPSDVAQRADPLPPLYPPA